MLVERQSAEHVQSRIRAGILESSIVGLLKESGLGERLASQALEHRGIYLQWPGERHHLDFTDLAGRPVWVYGQTDLTADLMRARAACGQQAFYQASHVTPHDAGTSHPYVTFTDDASAAQRVDADIPATAGCHLARRCHRTRRELRGHPHRVHSGKVSFIQ